jgi:hypothetical protein
MGIFKAYYLIRAVAAVHLYLGYVLLTAPGKLMENSTVTILGEALGLVRITSGTHCSSRCQFFYSSNNLGLPLSTIRSLLPSPACCLFSLASPT